MTGSRAGHDAIRRPRALAAELPGIDGLILSGGESSVFDKLARAFGLAGPLADAIRARLPTLATCAGLIYLARDIVDVAPGQQSLGLLDVTVRRNAFGRQVDSFDVELSIDGDTVPVSFIRAPEVVRVGENVEVIARTAEGRVVGVRSSAITALACHREATGDITVRRRSSAAMTGFSGNASSLGSWSKSPAVVSVRPSTEARAPTRLSPGVPQSHELYRARFPERLRLAQASCTLNYEEPC